MPKRKSVGKKEKTMGTVKEIIVLHGWAYTTDKWQEIINLFQDKSIKLNLLKIPGLTKPTNKSWTLDDYVNWLKKEIGSRKVILMGHSNGGRIALAFANQYPNSVSQLILIDSAGIYHNELSLRIKRYFYKHLAKIGKKVFPFKSLRNLLYKIIEEGDYKEADGLQKQTMVNLISQDLTPVLNNIKIPALIIWGGKDTITPLSDGKLIHKLLTNSKLKIISNAKHSPQFTHPKEVVKTIYEYL